MDTHTRCQPASLSAGLSCCRLRLRLSTAQPHANAGKGYEQYYEQ